MKKLATTFGLLALMLIVTSFTTPEIGGKNTGEDLGPKGPTTGTGVGTYSIGGKNTNEDLGPKGPSTGTGTGVGTYSIGGKNTGTNL